MAFTTATVANYARGSKQFQGAFVDQWVANLTVDPSSIAAAAEDTATFTIPGVALGDMVMVSPGVSLTATGEVSIDAWVSAANTVTIRLTNLHASSAADLGTSTWKLWVGRPSW
jgi:hypothetical protein